MVECTISGAKTLQGIVARDAKSRVTARMVNIYENAGGGVFATRGAMMVLEKVSIEESLSICAEHANTHVLLSECRIVGEVVTRQQAVVRRQ